MTPDEAPAPETTPATRLDLRLRVNGTAMDLIVEPRQTLLDVLRRQLGLTGAKRVCDMGTCGACTVVVDGKAVYSCLTLAATCDGREVRTIEGLVANGELDPIQKAFIAHDAYQCGYCTPGQIMSLRALLDERPEPTLDDVREAVSGNLCRCGAYPKIFAAGLAAAAAEREARDRGEVTDRG